MNRYTKMSMFRCESGKILNESELLIRENCIVYNDIVYERLSESTHKYRFFFDVDDYDYLENEELEKVLNELFMSK